MCSICFFLISFCFLRCIDYLLCILFLLNIKIRLENEPSNLEDTAALFSFANSIKKSNADYE